MKIAEVFTSIQGEGHLTGKPMRFIRLAGCTVTQCPLHPANKARVGECDTDWKYKTTEDPERLAAEALDEVGPNGWVSITGGEPLDQPEALSALIAELKRRGLQVNIQTGTSGSDQPESQTATASPPQAAAPADPHPSIKLTARQIKHAHQWSLPEGSDDLDTEWIIGYTPGNVANEDGDSVKPGMVMWMADYPEEGCLPLDCEDDALASPPSPDVQPDMLAVCAALGFDPTNHHNAAKCPYCRPAPTEATEGAAPARQQLSDAQIAKAVQEAASPMSTIQQIAEDYFYQGVRWAESEILSHQTLPPTPAPNFSGTGAQDTLDAVDAIQSLGASASPTACSVASLPEPKVSALRVPPAGATRRCQRDPCRIPDCDCPSA